MGDVLENIHKEVNQNSVHSVQPHTHPFLFNTMFNPPSNTMQLFHINQNHTQLFFKREKSQSSITAGTRKSRIS